MINTNSEATVTTGWACSHRWFGRRWRSCHTRGSTVPPGSPPSHSWAAAHTAPRRTRPLRCHTRTPGTAPASRYHCEGAPHRPPCSSLLASHLWRSRVLSFRKDAQPQMDHWMDSWCIPVEGLELGADVDPGLRHTGQHSPSGVAVSWQAPRSSHTTASHSTEPRLHTQIRHGSGFHISLLA